jgi:hypothetical protein
MLRVLDLLSSLALCIPSSRNIPWVLMRLFVLARGIYLLLRRTASFMRGTTSSDSSFSDGSVIPWNNIVSIYIKKFKKIKIYA